MHNQSPLLQRYAVRLAIVAVFLFGGPAKAADAPTRHQFDFGTGPATAGFSRVLPTDVYSTKAGFGFEAGAKLVDEKGAVTSERPFYFSVTLPEGNYRVKLLLGSLADVSTTTVKAELRRLMLEGVPIPANQTLSRSFVVNVRTPAFENGKVRLKAPRELVDEAWAWDEKLTLEFSGTHPSVRTIEIEAVQVPTIFILGDSTVCDQSKEPYASWGQMLPRFFKPTVAVANHAESGETVLGANSARRFDKVLSGMRAGDYLLIQFGHNDMKSKAADASGAYKAALRDWVQKVKAKGGTPVLITPVNRHSFDGAVVTNSLRDYPEKVRELAKEENVSIVDLNAMSKTLYEAFGPDPSIQLFEHTPDFKKFDGTHHSPFGAYELAKCVVEGLRKAKLPLVKELVDDLPAFEPAKPDSATTFTVPPSTGLVGERPLGD